MCFGQLEPPWSLTTWDHQLSTYVKWPRFCVDFALNFIVCMRLSSLRAAKARYTATPRSVPRQQPQTGCSMSWYGSFLSSGLGNELFALPLQPLEGCTYRWHSAEGSVFEPGAAVGVLRLQVTGILNRLMYDHILTATFVSGSAWMAW